MDFRKCFQRKTTVKRRKHICRQFGNQVMIDMHNIKKVARERKKGFKVIFWLE